MEKAKSKPKKGSPSKHPVIKAAGVDLTRRSEKKPGTVVARSKRLKTRSVGGRETKISITDNTTPTAVKPTEKQIVVRSKIQLALLSPYRFPMPQEKVIGSVARYAGVFFVVVGAFFSLLNLQYASGTLNPPGTLEAQTIGTTATYSVDDTGTTSNVNSTPDVRISIEGTTALVASTAVIMVTVPYASEVKLIAEYQSDGRAMTLGNAFRIDDFTWRYYWNTLQYPDGDYKLRAVIVNQHGTYDKLDGTVYTIRNSGETANATDSTSTAYQTGTTPVSTTTSISEPVLLAAHTVSLSVPEGILSGTIDFGIRTENASEIRVYARHTKSANLFPVGRASQSGSTWGIAWDSKNVPDGDYRFFAKATYANGDLAESAYYRRTVRNETLTSAVTTASTTTAVVPPPSESGIEPQIELTLSKTNPVSGFVDITVATDPVDWVELFAISKSSLTPFFLGLARTVSTGEWKYVWSTTQTPNGEYYVYARVKTPYGFSEGSRTTVRVMNEVISTYTAEQEKTISELTEANDAITVPAEDTYETPQTTYVEPVDVFVGSLEGDEDMKASVENSLTGFRMELNGMLNELAVAIRQGDQKELVRVQNEIKSLKERILESLASSVAQQETLDAIDAHLSQVSFELQELTSKNEKMLKERIGDAIVMDSDRDGILDYDEVNLYRTNPFAADTDGDSYIDSVEVKLGFNPHDPKSETLVTYESPKELGIVREDILAVQNIVTLTDEKKDGSLPARALISGKGLPNSYVTLYIYSTPIVLTVKTDSDGSWSYIFDKEIDQGSHEIYVGITDNAGRIVAKSNPLPFVKTANAYTGGDANLDPVPFIAAEPTLINDSVMLLVASISVVGLGLVLILLGLHVRGRREDSMLVQTA